MVDLQLGAPLSLSMFFKPTFSPSFSLVEGHSSVVMSTEENDVDVLCVQGLLLLSLLGFFEIVF